MKDKLYGVLSLKKEIELETMGIKTKLDLIWNDGQVGVMPVFNDYFEALY